MNMNYNFNFSATVLKGMMEDSKLDNTKIEYLLKYSKDFRENYFSLRNAIWREILWEGRVIKNELMDEALSGTDIFNGICKMSIPFNNAQLKTDHFFISMNDKLLEETSDSEGAIYDRMCSTFQNLLNGNSTDLEFNVYSLCLNREQKAYELEFSVRDTSDDLY